MYLVQKNKKNVRESFMNTMSYRHVQDFPPHLQSLLRDKK
jgi:hypothetical protein